MTYIRWAMCVLSVAILFYITMVMQDGRGPIQNATPKLPRVSHIVKNASSVRPRKSARARAPAHQPTLGHAADDLEDDDLENNDRGKVPRPGVFWLPSQEVYLTSAFLDTRYGGTVVRLVGVQHRDHRRPPVCVFGRRRVVSTVHLVFPYWPRESLFLAAVYTCPVPVADGPGLPGVGSPVPGHGPDPGLPGPYDDVTAVRVCSTRALPCVRLPLVRPGDDAGGGSGGATSRQRRQPLAVCAKAYRGALEWRRLVEWFETNRLAGVEVVLVYDGGVTGRARRVLEHYRRAGTARSLPFPLLGALQEHVSRNFRPSKEEYFSVMQQSYAKLRDLCVIQVFLTSLNDCVLRYSAQYEFFLIIDYDETLLPVRPESLFVTAQRHAARHPHATGFVFHTAWHFADFRQTPEVDNATMAPTPPPPLTTTTTGKAAAAAAAGNRDTPWPAPGSPSAPGIPVPDPLALGSAPGAPGPALGAPGQEPGTPGPSPGAPGSSPGDLYTLLHNRRTAVGADQPKALVRARPLVAVSWHGVTATHKGAPHAGLNVAVPPAPDAAYVHHYRGRCVDKFLRADCDIMLRRSYVDEVVPRYAHRMRARVAGVYRALSVWEA